MYPLLNHAVPIEREDEHDTGESLDSHLRSTKAVRGYHIQALDDQIGHVEDFLVDSESWTLRYMVIDTKNWLPGKKVLVSPAWISAIDWSTSLVMVDLFRDTIKEGPAYHATQGLSRDDEIALHHQYQRPGYWETSSD